MAAESQETKRSYQKEYRRRHRDRINARQREWAANHPEKMREYRRRYQESLSGGKNIRASWAAYGIDKKRLGELREIVRSGRYADAVLDAACKADEKSAAHIILSVMKMVSYDHLEFHYKLGRCPLGRTDFYGARRLFFHYLDITLKDLQEKERKGEER